MEEYSGSMVSPTSAGFLQLALQDRLLDSSSPALRDRTSLGRTVPECVLFLPESTFLQFVKHAEALFAAEFRNMPLNVDSSRPQSS